MHTLSLSASRHIVVAVTLAIATLVSWAFTDFQAPTIESAGTQVRQV